MIEKLKLSTLRARVARGELSPLEVADIINRVRIAGEPVPPRLEAWCERLWQRRRDKGTHLLRCVR